MKFEKPPANSGVSTETTEAANRFAARWEIEEAARRSEYVNPVMRRRVAELFEELSKSKGARDGRSKLASWRKMTGSDAEQRLAEFAERFASPPSLSREFIQMVAHEPVP